LESGRVASCLPIRRTSSKTKYVRLTNGRSLQHPKETSARAIVEGTRRTFFVLHSYVVVILPLRCVWTFHTFVGTFNRCSRISDLHIAGMGHVCNQKCNCSPTKKVMTFDAWFKNKTICMAQFHDANLLCPVTSKDWWFL